MANVNLDENIRISDFFYFLVVQINILYSQRGYSKYYYKLRGKTYKNTVVYARRVPRWLYVTFVCVCVYIFVDHTYRFLTFIIIIDEIYKTKRKVLYVCTDTLIRSSPKLHKTWTA